MRRILLVVLFTLSGLFFGGEGEEIVSVPEKVFGYGILTSNVVFSPDGKTFAAGSSDGRTRLWNVETGKVIITIAGIGCDVLWVAFSPDGTKLVTGQNGMSGIDSTAILWDAATGSRLKTFSGHSKGVTSVAFSPDGKLLLTGSQDGTAKLWDITTNSCLRTDTCGSAYTNTQVCFSSDGTRILTSAGVKATLRDISTGDTIRTYTGHFYAITSIAFSPDGEFIVSGSHDSTAIVRKTGSVGELYGVFEGHAGCVSSCVFSPDGTTLLTGSYDKTAKLWDLTNGKCTATLSGHIGYVTTVAHSPDGKTVLTGSGDNSRVQLPDGDNTIKLWDAATGKCLQTFGGHTGYINSVTYTPDGTAVLVGADNAPTLWDIASETCIAIFEGHTDGIKSIKVSGDGKTLLTGSWDQTAKLWDVASRKCIRTFTTRSNTVTADISPDEASIVTANERLILWNAATGDSIKIFKKDATVVSYMSDVAFSPDGSKLLTGSFMSWKIAGLWDVALDTLQRKLEGHTRGINSVAFSPDGNLLLTGSGDKTAKLWDAATGTCIRTFEGHGASIESVAFAPDGATVCTGDWNATLKLWDAATGSCLRTFTSHARNTDVICDVAYSPDGRHLLSGTWNCTALSWSLEGLSTTLPPVRNNGSASRPGIFAMGRRYLNIRNAENCQKATLHVFDLNGRNIARLVVSVDSRGHGRAMLEQPLNAGAYCCRLVPFSVKSASMSGVMMVK